MMNQFYLNDRYDSHRYYQSGFRVDMAVIVTNCDSRFSKLQDWILTNTWFSFISRTHIGTGVVLCLFSDEVIVFFNDNRLGCLFVCLFRFYGISTFVGYL